MQFVSVLRRAKVESVDDDGCIGHRDIAALLRQSFLPRIGRKVGEKEFYLRAQRVSTVAEGLDKTSNKKRKLPLPIHAAVIFE
jgi:hypothetical protein